MPDLAARMADNGVVDLSSDRSGQITAVVNVDGVPPAQRRLTMQPMRDGQPVDLSQPAAGSGPYTWACRSPAPVNRLPTRCR